MEIVSNVALISINETLIVQLISFLIFLFLITRIMFRPLRKVMHEREVHIESVQKEIAESKKIIDYCRHELDRRMQTARQEARFMNRELEASGIVEAEKIFESAQQEILAIRESTANEIANEIAKARAAAAAESESLALAVMEKMLDRRVSP